MVIMSVGEYTYNSQTSEGSESTLLVAFLCATDLITAERNSLVR